MKRPIDVKAWSGAKGLFCATMWGHGQEGYCLTMGGVTSDNSRSVFVERQFPGTPIEQYAAAAAELESISREDVIRLLGLEE